LEFWHFDCSEIETAHRILPSFFRSTTGVQDFSVWNRSSVSISGSADASQRNRFFRAQFLPFACFPKSSGPRELSSPRPAKLIGS
jgi:hypothetical protein